MSLYRTKRVKTPPSWALLLPMLFLFSELASPLQVRPSLQTQACQLLPSDPRECSTFEYDGVGNATAVPNPSSGPGNGTTNAPPQPTPPPATLPMYPLGNAYISESLVQAIFAEDVMPRLRPEVTEKLKYAILEHLASSATFSSTGCHGTVTWAGQGLSLDFRISGDKATVRVGNFQVTPTIAAGAKIKFAGSVDVTVGVPVSAQYAVYIDLLIHHFCVDHNIICHPSRGDVALTGPVPFEGSLELFITPEGALSVKLSDFSASPALVLHTHPACEFPDGPIARMMKEHIPSEASMNAEVNAKIQSGMATAVASMAAKMKFLLPTTYTPHPGIIVRYRFNSVTSMANSFVFAEIVGKFFFHRPGYPAQVFVPDPADGATPASFPPSNWTDALQQNGDQLMAGLRLSSTCMQAAVWVAHKNLTFEQHVETSLFGSNITFTSHFSLPILKVEKNGVLFLELEYGNIYGTCIDTDNGGTTVLSNMEVRGLDANGTVLQTVLNEVYGYYLKIENLDNFENATFKIVNPTAMLPEDMVDSIARKVLGKLVAPMDEMLANQAQFLPSVSTPFVWNPLLLTVQQPIEGSPNHGYLQFATYCGIGDMPDPVPPAGRTFACKATPLTEPPLPTNAPPPPPPPPPPVRMPLVMTFYEALPPTTTTTTTLPSMKTSEDAGLPIVCGASSQTAVGGTAVLEAHQVFVYLGGCHCIHPSSNRSLCFRMNFDDPSTAISPNIHDEGNTTSGIATEHSWYSKLDLFCNEDCTQCSISNSTNVEPQTCYHDPVMCSSTTGSTAADCATVMFAPGENAENVTKKDDAPCVMAIPPTADGLLDGGADAGGNVSSASFLTVVFFADGNCSATYFINELTFGIQTAGGDASSWRTTFPFMGAAAVADLTLAGMATPRHDDSGQRSLHHTKLNASVCPPPGATPPPRSMCRYYNITLGSPGCFSYTVAEGQLVSFSVLQYVAMEVCPIGTVRPRKGTGSTGTSMIIVALVVGIGVLFFVGLTVWRCRKGVSGKRDSSEGPTGVSKVRRLRLWWSGACTSNLSLCINSLPWTSSSWEATVRRESRHAFVMGTSALFLFFLGVCWRYHPPFGVVSSAKQAGLPQAVDLTAAQAFFDDWSEVGFHYTLLCSLGCFILSVLPMILRHSPPLRPLSQHSGEELATTAELVQVVGSDAAWNVARMLTLVACFAVVTAVIMVPAFFANCISLVTVSDDHGVFAGQSSKGKVEQALSVSLCVETLPLIQYLRLFFSAGIPFGVLFGIKLRSYTTTESTVGRSTSHVQQSPEGYFRVASDDCDSKDGNADEEPSNRVVHAVEETLSSEKQAPSELDNKSAARRIDLTSSQPRDQVLDRVFSVSSLGSGQGRNETRVVIDSSANLNSGDLPTTPPNTSGSNTPQQVLLSDSSFQHSTQTKMDQSAIDDLTSRSGTVGQTSYVQRPPTPPCRGCSTTGPPGQCLDCVSQVWEDNIRNGRPVAEGQVDVRKDVTYRPGQLMSYDTLHGALNDSEKRVLARGAVGITLIHANSKDRVLRRNEDAPDDHYRFAVFHGDAVNLGYEHFLCLSWLGPVPDEVLAHESMTTPHVWVRDTVDDIAKHLCGKNATWKGGVAFSGADVVGNTCGVSVINQYLNLADGNPTGTKVFIRPKDLTSPQSWNPVLDRVFSVSSLGSGQGRNETRVVIDFSANLNNGDLPTTPPNTSGSNTPQQELLSDSSFQHSTQTKMNQSAIDDLASRSDDLEHREVREHNQLTMLQFLSCVVVAPASMLTCFSLFQTMDSTRGGWLLLWVIHTVFSLFIVLIARSIERKHVGIALAIFSLVVEMIMVLSILYCFPVKFTTDKTQFVLLHLLGIWLSAALTISLPKVGFNEEVPVPHRTPSAIGLKECLYHTTAKQKRPKSRTPFLFLGAVALVFVCYWASEQPNLRQQLLELIRKLGVYVPQHPGHLIFDKGIAAFQAAMKLEGLIIAVATVLIVTAMFADWFGSLIVSQILVGLGSLSFAVSLFSIALPDYVKESELQTFMFRCGTAFDHNVMQLAESTAGAFFSVLIIERVMALMLTFPIAAIRSVILLIGERRITRSFVPYMILCLAMLTPLAIDMILIIGPVVNPKSPVHLPYLAMAVMGVPFLLALVPFLLPERTPDVHTGSTTSLVGESSSVTARSRPVPQFIVRVFALFNVHLNSGSTTSTVGESSSVTARSCPVPRFSVRVFAYAWYLVFVICVATFGVFVVTPTEVKKWFENIGQNYPTIVEVVAEFSLVNVTLVDYVLPLTRSVGNTGEEPSDDDEATRLT